MLTCCTLCAGCGGGQKCTRPTQVDFPCTLHQGNRCGFAAETLSRTSFWTTTDASGQEEVRLRIAAIADEFRLAGNLYSVMKALVKSLSEAICAASETTKDVAYHWHTRGPAAENAKFVLKKCLHCSRANSPWSEKWAPRTDLQVDPFSCVKQLSIC